MKKLMILLMLVIMTAGLSAKTNISTLADFTKSVRMELSIANNAMLPDSVLTDICQRSILWTSTDCGGVEYTFPIVTVEKRAFYAMPDSVVEILFATIVSGDYTRSIKAWYPQYAEDVFGSNLGVDEGQAAIPGAYNYWADTVQLIPVPIQADSIFFKAYVEHPAVTTSTDSILLKPPFIEAAISYACHLCFKRMQEYDIATYYLNEYGQLKTSLREKYVRKMDAMAQNAK